MVEQGKLGEKGAGVRTKEPRKKRSDEGRGGSKKVCQRETEGGEGLGRTGGLQGTDMRGQWERGRSSWPGEGESARTRDLLE